MSEILKNKCRTCLKTNTKLKPLNTKPNNFKINKTYLDLLRYVTHLEIMSDTEEDECQYGVCFKCCRRIRDAYMFNKQVLKCNSYFLKESKASESLEELETNDSFMPCAAVVKEEKELPHNDISVNGPKVENDSDASISSMDDNCDDIPLSMYASDKTHYEKNDVKLFDAVNIKSEHNNFPEKFQLSSQLECNRNNIFTIIPNSYNDSDRLNSNDSKFEDPLGSEGIKDEGDNNSDDDIDNDNNNDIDNKKGKNNEDANNDDIDKDKDNDNKTKSALEYDDKLIPVKCDECEKIFENSLLLDRHKKDTHIPDELKIQCPKCPVRFSRRYNMYAHMRSFHKTETVRAHQIQPRKLVKTDVCEQCNRAYSDKYKLMAHIKNKHGPESPPKKQKQPPKRYLCTLCGLTCCSQSNLDIHYRRHTGEKPYKCDFCTRAYARLYDVQVHRRTHTGEAPFKCTVCEKAFKRSNKLKIHMRTHTNERPYKCTQCEKAFKQSKDLNIHKRTHTGERPYKCNVCNSTYTQSNSLKMHQTKTKHGLIEFHKTSQA